MKILRAICVSLLLSLVPSVRADEPNLKQTLDLVEGASKAIRTCDVYLTATMKFLVHSERQEKTNGKYELIARPLAPGESPLTVEYVYRQVFKDKKRRFESFKKGQAEPWQLIVSNSEISRTYIPEQHEGTRDRPVVSEEVLSGASDYSTYYRNLVGPVDLFACLRERKTTRVVVDKNAPELITLQCDPEPKNLVSFSPWGFSVSADPNHRLMLATVSWTNPNAPATVSRRMIVNEFKRIPEDVWVPVRITTTGFWSAPGPLFGKPISELVVEVDVAKSRWNEDILDSTFILPFPAGTHVFDRLRNADFITGKDDPGVHLNDLARDARNMVALHSEQPSEPARGLLSGTGFWMIFGFLSVSSGSLLFIFYRARKGGLP